MSEDQLEPEARSASEALNETIVSKLVEQRDRNDIIQAVCEQSNLDWDQADRLVSQVELDHAHAIARRQMPMLVFLSAATALVGILLLTFSIQTIMDSLSGEPLLQLLQIVGGSYPLWAGIFGLSMIAGGLIGMWQSMLRYFET